MGVGFPQCCNSVRFSLVPSTLGSKSHPVILYSCKLVSNETIPQVIKNVPAVEVKQQCHLFAALTVALRSKEPIVPIPFQDKW